MEKSYSESYKEAGVDITAGYKAVELMKKHVARTMPEGKADIGGFGGLFPLDVAGMKKPMLVSGTDGVGTKIKLAFLMDKHDTVGIDCVAMCVNDIVCCGAKPIVFLDYIACGRNFPEKIAAIVGGVAEGCVRAGCALVGGETAEHPGLMPEEEYDLAGFAVGVVDAEKVIDNTRMKAGDVMLALPSSGVHSNGFSLVRKVFDVEHCDLAAPVEELGGKSLGEVLLTPTEIYVKPVLALLQEVEVKGISHITGGGFYENMPRSIPKGLGVKIKRADVKVLPIFDLIQKKGNVSEHDMFNTFNMGVGMSIVVAKEDVEKAISVLKANGEDAYVLGAEKGSDRRSLFGRRHQLAGDPRQCRGWRDPLGGSRARRLGQRLRVRARTRRKGRGRDRRVRSESRSVPRGTRGEDSLRIAGKEDRASHSGGFHDHSERKVHAGV